MAKRSSRRPRASAAAPAPETAQPAGKVDLAEEYRYVITDLKRIGVIAVILIGALVVLSFFL